MLSNLKPEETLCCILSRPLLSNADVEHVEEIVQSGVDWQEFLTLVQRNKILPLVHRHFLGALLNTVPVEVRKVLRAQAIATAKRSAVLADELAAALEQMTSAGIKAVPFKGPLLAKRILGDETLCDCLDLDILVKAADLRRTVQTLIGCGYTVADDSFGHFVVLARNHPLGFPICIDLQTRAVPAWMDRRGKSQGLWERILKSQFCGKDVWFLSDDWNLVIIALHSLKHWFRHLHHAFALFGLLQVCEEHWPMAIRRAEEMGMRREAELARRVCEMILGEERVSANDVNAFALRLVQAPFGSDLSKFVWRRVQLAARQGFFEKAVYLASWPFVPAPQDTSALQLPPWLRPLHFVLRPLRLAWTYLVHAPLRYLASLSSTPTTQSQKPTPDATPGHPADPASRQDTADR